MKSTFQKFNVAIAFIASALVSTARADERMSQSQTALGSTTIGGFVQSAPTFYSPQNVFGTQSRMFLGQHQFEYPHFQNAERPSLTPLPPPSLENNTVFQSSSFVLTLVDTPVQPIALPLAADSSSDSGACMVEAIRADKTIATFQFSIAPPADFQIQLDQAGIQPVPEPSTFMLGGLAFGLIALRRLNKNANKL